MQKITRIAALLLVALAVVLAIVAFSLGRHALKPATAAPAALGVTVSSGSTTQVDAPSMVVAGNVLTAGQPIAAASLRTINPPRPVPDSYAHIDAVTGDVPLVDIPAGTAITAGLLAHGVAMVLKPGERALAVPVDELSGAGNRILPGDYVDVFLSLKATQPAGIQAPPAPAQTRLLLSRMRVLAYGSQNLPALPSTAVPNEDEKSPAKPDNSTPPTPRTAVLAIPVNMASRLLLGAQSGTLSLALRHPDDDGQPDGALFPQPRTVLSPLATLTVEQKQRLASPENRAYAGIVGPGLAGLASSSAAPSRTLRRTRSMPSLEIIRGTQRGDRNAAWSASR